VDGEFIWSLFFGRRVAQGGRVKMVAHNDIFRNSALFRFKAVATAPVAPAPHRQLGLNLIRRRALQTRQNLCDDRRHPRCWPGS
jgi:hypothetical protein